MADFGLTAQGFVPLDFADVRQSIESSLRAKFGSNIRLEDESVFGQFVAISAEQYASLWSAQEAAYLAGFIGGAAETALDDVVALAGIRRRPATYSQIVLTLEGDDGTDIPEGSIVQDPVLGLRWITTADATIPGSLTIDVAARAEFTGPVVGLNGSVTEIVTAISGWDTVTNADAEPGRAVETDAALRERFFLSFRVGGGCSTDAIAALIGRVGFETDDPVLTVTVYENTTDLTDVYGRPPHSFEAIVSGGDDQAIIDAIFASKPAGIRAYGTNVSGTAIDALGAGHTIEFTRPVDADMDIEIDYSLYAGAADNVEDLIEAEVLDFGYTIKVGQEVSPWQIGQKIETGYIRTLEIRVARTGDPATTSPVFIDIREVAKFDSARITFTEV